MSLCQKGLEAKLTDTAVTLKVAATEPLAALANALDWRHIAALAIPDLKRTAKGGWYLGRRLSLRSHLAVMILQTLLKETDRGIERRIRDTPVLQVFCGCSVLPAWHCPDHTKIEELRNRLTPATHKAIGDYVVTVAVRFGFADVAWMDVDSTVQEANIRYPADSVLMKQLAEKAHRVLTYLQAKRKTCVPATLNIDIERIRQSARRYFFLSRSAPIEERRALFARYHRLVKRELRAVIGFYGAMSERRIGRFPWHIRPATCKARPPPEALEPLKRRRAGIEPLIQHAKSFGLGRSRMKSDETTLASGYRAVMGFNLHQLMRHMQAAAT